MDHPNIHDRQEYLASKWRNKTITPEETTELLNWLNIDEERDVMIPVSFASSEEDLRKDMYQKINSAIGYKVDSDRKVIYKLWPRLAAAAAILLIVGLSIFFYSRYINTLRHSGAGQNLGLAGNDIKPGGNKAYLVLSNGKRLSLTDAANGAIAKEAGVEITKTADGQVVYESRHPELDSGSPLNTIETPKGGQYQVRLPDGSKVWLNAASKLIYPVTFTGRGQREVTLSGEAYFEIAKDKQHPFHVKSAGQVVEVLGTHFNINNYPDEPNIKTTLLEGSVKVNDAILKPNQQAILKNNKINILPIDAQSEIAWKNGYFSFNDESIQNIMRVLTRWYDIEVSYQGHITTDGFNGKFSRYKDISQVLKVLEQTKLVHFKIEGRRVMVSN